MPKASEQIQAKLKSLMGKRLSASYRTCDMRIFHFGEMRLIEAEKMLKDGETLKKTQSAIVLEKLIGKFLFDKAAEGEGDAK